MTITRNQKEIHAGHKSFVLWFTGLSGSGKSTLAQAVEARLFDRQYKTAMLDGDVLRGGLCKDLGFCADDRSENIRRAAEVARLFIENGSIVLAAFISPFQIDRDAARRIIGPHDFVEVYCKCPYQICETRDVKGLYQKAKEGQLLNFSGKDLPYEPPVSPDIILDTNALSIDACVRLIIEEINGLL